MHPHACSFPFHFSSLYLRSAVEASLDMKKFHRNETSAILSSPIFFPHRYFVVSDILSKVIICHRQYFFLRQYFFESDILINGDILSKTIFCRRRYFFFADILSAVIFCRQRYFSIADIFSSTLFCLQRHFVESDILASPIFFLRRYFVGSDIFLKAIFSRYFFGPIFLIFTQPSWDGYF